MSELTVRNQQRTRPIDVGLFRRIALSLLRDQLGLRTCEISVCFVGARRMAALNENYLQHTGSTDVITFGYGPRRASDPLVGDIFICIDEAERQARQFKTSWQSEVMRYFVHGLLHLQGHDDAEPPRRRVMKREENKLLRQLQRRFNLARLYPSAP